MSSQSAPAKSRRKPKVLITGAAGGLAGVAVEFLSRNFKLVGADLRAAPLGRHKFPGEFHQVDYNHRKMAEIFREHSFDALLHLGRMPTVSSSRSSIRYNTNVLGTQNLLTLAKKYGVKQVVVVSTYHVYGAHQHNHVHIAESDPLRASQIFPELVDAIELDHVSRMFLLQNPEIRTVILRPVSVVGPRLSNQITRLLRAQLCPVLLGYDPMMQFIHESDFARALKLALEGEHSGVYNVAGEGAVPYQRAVRLAGATPVPVPHFLVYAALNALSQVGVGFPKHLVDYFRYPTIVSDDAFRRDFQFVPSVTVTEALASIRAAVHENPSPEPGGNGESESQDVGAVAPVSRAQKLRDRHQRAQKLAEGTKPVGNRQQK